MGMQENQQRMFGDRLKRISAGGANTTAQVYVGTLTSDDLAGAEPRSFMSEMLMVPFGFLIGALSLLCARLAFFHVFSASNAIWPDYNQLAGLLYVDIIIGIFIALVVGRMFTVDRGMRFLALSLGFVLVLWGQSFMLAVYPEVFAILFSESYVTENLGLLDLSA